MSMTSQMQTELEPLLLLPSRSDQVELSSPCQVVPTCDLSPRTSPASLGSPHPRTLPNKPSPLPIFTSTCDLLDKDNGLLTTEGPFKNSIGAKQFSEESDNSWQDLAEIQPSLTTPDFMSASSSSQLNFDDFFFTSPSQINPHHLNQQHSQLNLDQKILTAFPDSTVSSGSYLLPEHHHQSNDQDENGHCGPREDSPLNFFQPCHESEQRGQQQHDIMTPPPSMLYQTHTRRKQPKENVTPSYSHHLNQQQQCLPIKLEPGSPDPDCFSSGSVDTPPLFEAYGGLLKQESGGSGTDLDTSLEIYRDLILRHLVQDIGSTCGKLGIPTDPQNWSPDQTLVWLQEMTAQFRLGEAPLTQLYLPGQILTQMSKEDFLMSAPETGDTLHAQLQIWKTASEFQSLQTPQQLSGGQPRRSSSISTSSSCGSTPAACSSRGETSSSADEWLATFDPSLDGVYAAGNSAGTNGPLSIHTNNSHQMPYPPSLCLPIVNATKLTGLPQLLPSPSDSDSGISADYEEFMLQESNLVSSLGRKRVGGGGIGSSGGGSIHLWQFIRELLDQPETFGQCVRWIDRTDGIFKIEDSHKLARLWGQRKNRHKMNYDKLSRSLRQYYKKNIIKKTGQRQRLIYQFIPPYHLL